MSEQQFVMEINNVTIRGKDITEVLESDIELLSQDEVTELFSKKQELTFSHESFDKIMNKDYVKDLMEHRFFFNSFNDEEVYHFTYRLLVHLAVQKNVAKEFKIRGVEKPVGQMILTDFIYSIYSNRELLSYFEMIDSTLTQQDSKHLDETIYLVLQIFSNLDVRKLFSIRRNRYMEPLNYMTKAGGEILIIQIYLDVELDIIYSAQSSAYPLQLREKPNNYTLETRPSSYIKNGGYCQNQDVLDVLNQLQSIEWELSPYIQYQTIEELIYKKKLSERYDLYTKKIINEQTNAYEIVCVESVQSNATITAHQYSTNYIMLLKHRVELIGSHKVFFKWEIDRGGRMYSNAYQLNHMGADYEKSILIPSNKNFSGRLVTDENRILIKDGIYLGIAQLLDQDKETFSNQIAIGKEYYLSSKCDAEKDYTKPHFPLMMNYFDSIEKVENNVYPNTFVYLDASNQALQIYALLLKDKQVASLCNLSNGNIRADAYQVLADSLNQIISSKTNNATVALTRTHVKHVLMTTLYGKMDTTEILYSALRKDTNVEIGRCGEKSTISEAVLNCLAPDDFNDANKEDTLMEILKLGLEKIAPSVTILMNQLLQINEKLTQEVYSWTLPDGFEASYRVKTKEKNSVVYGRNDYLNRDEEMLFIHEYYKADKYSRGLAALIVQSIDAYIAREMIRRMNGKFIVTIHDAFGCHPEDLELMKQNYNDILCEMLDMNLLEIIVTEIVENVTSDFSIKFNLPNDLTKNDIADSIYKLS